MVPCPGLVFAIYQGQAFDSRKRGTKHSEKPASSICAVVHKRHANDQALRDRIPDIKHTQASNACTMERSMPATDANARTGGNAEQGACANSLCDAWPMMGRRNLLAFGDARAMKACNDHKNGCERVYSGNSCHSRCHITICTDSGKVQQLHRCTEVTTKRHENVGP